MQNEIDNKILKLKQEIKKLEFEEFKKSIPEPIIKETKKTNSDIIKKQLNLKIFRIYIILSFNIVVVLGLCIFFYSIKQIILFILCILFGFPIFVLSLLFYLIKLYRDKNKIKGFLINKLSKNFINAYFFTQNRKIKKLIFRVSGNEIIYNNGLYIIDEKCVWYNTDKEPIIFYLENIPNPIKFNFMKYIKKYDSAKIKSEVLDDNLELLDLSYSSDGIQKFKKDKLFSELHKSETLINTSLLFGLIILVIIVIAIILITRQPSA